MSWLKEILLSFFYEIDDIGNHSDEEIEHYADRCIEQIGEAVKNRLDLEKEEDREKFMREWCTFKTKEGESNG